MGRSLHRAGLNLDLAPVTDVVPAGTEELNQPIGQYHRQYGSTAAAVGAAAGRSATGWPATGSPPPSSTIRAWAGSGATPTPSPSPTP